MTDNEYHGSMRMADGSRVNLTAEAAKEIWEHVEKRRAERAQQMPTARDALAAIVDAQARLNELGWWLNGSLGVRRGDDCAVAESGSTGMWRGWLDDNGEYVNYAGCVSKPRYTWMKKLDQLTDDEKTWMVECDENAAKHLW